PSAAGDTTGPASWAMAPTRTAAPPPGWSGPATMSASSAPSGGLDDHRGAVGQDLGRAVHHGGGGHAQAGDRVGAHAVGLGPQAIERLLAALGQHAGVLVDLAADDAAQAGEEVGA